jgi:hypothetical protein
MLGGFRVIAIQAAAMMAFLPGLKGGIDVRLSQS